MKCNGTLFIFLSLVTGISIPMEQPNTPATGALHAAVLKLNLDQARLVLGNKSAHIHERDKQGNTAYHILKAQKALMPLLATSNGKRKKIESKIAAIDSLLLSAGSNPDSYNNGNLTPLAWYSFLNQDIQRDSILPKYAPIPIVKESLLFNGFPKKYIMEDSNTHLDLDEFDHSSLIIKQVRGNQKIYLKLEKLNPNASTLAQNTPVMMTSKTREKVSNSLDALHNFSTIIDQYLHWGKKIHTDDIKNNAWVHLVLSNLKFAVKDSQADIYAVLIKAYYCSAATTDTRSFQEIIKTQELQPVALIYLFFDDSDVCYHRCLHNACDKNKFEDGFTRLQTKLK